MKRDLEANKAIPSGSLRVRLGGQIHTLQIPSLHSHGHGSSSGGVSFSSGNDNVLLCLGLDFVFCGLLLFWVSYFGILSWVLFCLVWALFYLFFFFLFVVFGVSCKLYPNFENEIWFILTKKKTFENIKYIFIIYFTTWQSLRKHIN